MRTSRIAWCFAIATMVGCTDHVTEPVEQDVDFTGPSAKAVHISFEQESYFNEVLYMSCLDENVWVRGRVLVEKGRVFQPSGNASRWTLDLAYYGLPFGDLDYFGDEYTILGLDSRDVWTFEKAANNAGKMHWKKDGFVYHQVSNIWFRNQDGEKLHYNEVYTLHCPWEGEFCSLEKVRGTCPTDLPR